MGGTRGVSPKRTKRSGFSVDQEWREEVGGSERESERENENKIGCKFIFWNVAGLKKKGVDFWKEIAKFDFISLSETWVEDKKWENWREGLPEDFIWECIGATREKKKGGQKEVF